jgi:GntR family transcriptional repressor for pyruvate dehydrogenase complex
MSAENKAGDPVARPRAAAALADELRGLILSGEWGPNTLLPSEWELVEQKGVTRSSVREALLILKRDGLIVTRAGRNGGSVVVRPSPSNLVASLDVFIQGQAWADDDATLL